MNKNHNQAKIIIPLCEKCLNNQDKICEKCNKKYAVGLINKTDIRCMRAICEAISNFENINIVIYKIIACSETFLILCSKASKSKLIGNKGIIAKKIAHKIKHNISIIAIPSAQTNENFLNFFKQIFGEQAVDAQITPQTIKITLSEDLQSKYLVKNEYLLKELGRALKLAEIKQKLVVLNIKSTPATQ
ncbi:MAG: hypothetical protein COW47_00230 [Candidatus Huberarchaeum crystalense]|uniref:KH domain-containing protein n=1 Tax=Huberarchaeum crystalense TaxID=2014257 RepID=A0A2G9LJC6_HUBC1|nr:MAG: hypothetical protein COW69_01130 [Candidatus Huberarchaeum crystalense]PIV13838.1 MAG: hypothetical protein COS45_00770 [Candidatus Huberarchaeum crystalense]PIV46489.1 MAG: hypothetical protein COS22_01065 [Candidatus Huberarchaeum crystalense]PIV89903.1 MAG: hypothetical protein COW47_00230 [Candidatus Huberarchaeum crystalense]PIX28128.1 MAG: hypothetical protein COZ66_01135 [Candidatus Huberarchaeum crystalense]